MFKIIRQVYKKEGHLVKIGLLGFSSKISQSVYDALYLKYEIVKIFSLEHQEDNIFCHDINEVLNANIDCLIECLSDTELAYNYAQKALKKGIRVIVSNKIIMAKHYTSLLNLALENHTNISFESCVVGGVSILHHLEDLRQYDDILKIEGILNSTVNYILGIIFKKKISFEKALDEAQKLGYTKPDYNNDLLGKDAAYKLALIYNKAFAANISSKDIFVKGIKYLDEETIMFARLHETQIRLIAHMNKQNAYVIPFFVRKKDMYHYVNGKSNCIMIETSNIGKIYDVAQSVGIQAITNGICLDLIRPLQNIIINEANIINDDKYHFYLSKQIIDDKYIDLKMTKGCITIMLTIHELGELIQNSHIFVGALLDEEYRDY